MSLTCICCGALGHVVVSNINKHLAFGSILADCQRGFRSRGSCEARLVQFFRDLVSGLDRALNRGHRRTDVIIMDFAGAFGGVPRGRLLCRLGCCGIGGSARGWIASWLSGRFRGVVLGGRASGPVPVLSGVRQGSVLGPVLFLIFIGDLPENIGSSVRLFADDCVLYGSIGSPAGCRILQDDLNSLAQWEAGWRMEFSVARCCSVGVTRRPPGGHVQFDCTLHQQGLEQVQSARCLGITISDDLGWGQRVSWVSSRATRTLGFLRRNLAFAPRHTGEVAYKTLVRPGLECAAPIWRPCREAQVGRVGGGGGFGGQLPGGPAGDGETQVASATCLTILGGHPWGPAGSSLP